MEISKKRKKVLGVILILILLQTIIGVTYAYFTVNNSNNFGTKSLRAQAGPIGNVILNGRNANLLLNLTAPDMMKKGSNVTYYASSSNKTTTPTEEIVGVASVSPDTDTNSYHCTYTLEVTHTGTNDMYDLFNKKTNDTFDYEERSAGQIILTINGVDYDFTGEWPSEVEGSFDISGNETVNITAGLRIINSNTIDQVYLAGSNIDIDIKVKEGSFKCSAYKSVTFASVLEDEIENGLMKEYMNEGNYTDTEHPFFTNHIYHWFGTYNSTKESQILNKWNVVFGEFCWQMIRTTENGGIKLLYNGEARKKNVNGNVTYDCGEDRPSQLLNKKTTAYIPGNKWYGTEYTFDGTKFSISGEKSQVSWSEENSDSLIGKYTCDSTSESGTCNELYQIDSYLSSTNANVTLYYNNNYSSIGQFRYYDGYNYFQMGYMYNNILQEERKTLNNGTNYKFSNLISYNDITGKYTLDMTDSNSLDETDWSTSGGNINKIGKAHYICIDSDNNLLSNTLECEKIGYAFYTSGTLLSFVPLSNGEYISTDESIENKFKNEKNILYKALYSDNSNIKNSLIKNVIDEWYIDNLKQYERYIDKEEIYCNDRRTSNNYGSFNENAANMTTELLFEQYEINGNINCPSKASSYSATRTTYGNGALTNPIGLASSSELYLLNNSFFKSNLRKGQRNYWLMSPYSSNIMRNVNMTGDFKALSLGSYNLDVRPSIALLPTVQIISGGDGSMTNPYVVKTN